MIPIRAGFARGGTSCNAAMCPRGRAPQAVVGLTLRVKYVKTKNINTRAHFLMPCSGQLRFLGSSARFGLACRVAIIHLTELEQRIGRVTVQACETVFELGRRQLANLLFHFSGGSI